VSIVRSFPPLHMQPLVTVWCSFGCVLQTCSVVTAAKVADRPARPRTQHDCHHDTKVKPEVATAVTELPMMGGKTPETCWAVNKRQGNKLETFRIWLVIYLDCTMMHGLTNLKLASVLRTQVVFNNAMSPTVTNVKLSHIRESWGKKVYNFGRGV
jgi:hypothetical protein